MQARATLRAVCGLSGSLLVGLLLAPAPAGASERLEGEPRPAEEGASLSAAPELRIFPMRFSSTTESPPATAREVNLHLSYVPIARGASLLGAGVGLRYLATPHYGLDVGVEASWGRDYNALLRKELGTTLAAVFVFNPEGLVEAACLLGLAYSGARVQGRVTPTRLSGERSYLYLGTFMGPSFALRIADESRVTVDVVGLMRDRLNPHQGEPEFIDQSRLRATNASAAAVFRLGVSRRF